MSSVNGDAVASNRAAKDAAEGSQQAGPRSRRGYRDPYRLPDPMAPVGAGVAEEMALGLLCRAYLLLRPFNMSDDRYFGSGDVPGFNETEYDGDGRALGTDRSSIRLVHVGE